MAVVQMQMVGICAGGDHVTVNWRVDGGAITTEVYTVSDLMTVPTPDERRDIIRQLIRTHAIGKTKAQLRTDLEAILTVTI